MIKDYYDIKWNPVDVDYDTKLKLINHRLAIPEFIKEPKKILVNDNGVDLFGEKIPGEWIRKVLKIAEENKQHKFLLLTKNPKRYIEFNPYPDNVWTGMKASTQVEYIKDRYLKSVESPVRYIAFDPVKEYIRPLLGGIDWVVIGKDQDKVQRNWVINLVNECRDYNIEFYIRPSLHENFDRLKRYKDYPRKYRSF